MKAVKTTGIISFILVLGFSLASCNLKAKRIEAEKAYIAAVDAYGAEKYDNSLEQVRRAIKLDRNFYQASFLEGKILFFSEKQSEAEKIFSGLTSKYPEFTEARIWHIRCLILKGDFEAAQKMLDKELSYNQTDWRIYSLYSLFAQRTNNYEERLTMNRRAETILSGSARVYIDMALVWHTLGLDDRAKTYIEKAQQVSGANIPFQELEKALYQTLWEK
jgi:tetratricopeptide (TPR) repeat protein